MSVDDEIDSLSRLNVQDFRRLLPTVRRLRCPSRRNSTLSRRVGRCELRITGLNRHTSSAADDSTAAGYCLCACHVLSAGDEVHRALSCYCTAARNGCVTLASTRCRSVPQRRLAICDARATAAYSLRIVYNQLLSDCSFLCRP